MEREALAKGHCTVSESLQVGLDMKARRVLLTHFSQRYPKVAPLESLPADALGSYLIAHDLMRVRASDLAWMPHSVPVIQGIFLSLCSADAAEAAAPSE
jgi:ribonuclease Z